MKKLLICLFLALAALPAFAQMKRVDLSTIKNKFLDIPYATVSKAEMLDLYLPDEGSGPFPVIVAIHGGAWLGGDKRDGQEAAMLEGLKRGFAVASINYRLAGEARWPAQIADCKAAVRWLRANAGTYKLDTGRIAAWGGSAGGHLAAMLGTAVNVPAFEDSALGNPDQSSRVQAVVDWFGPTDLLTMDARLNESGLTNPMRRSPKTLPETILLGKVAVENPELARTADPETYVTAGAPPFMIQHGLEDVLVPYQGSVHFARALGKAIGFAKVSLELFPANGHGGPAFGTPENIARVFAFLERWLQR